MVSTRSPRVGVVISALELCAVRAAGTGGRDVVFRAPLEPFGGDTNQWPSLAAALRELAVRDGNGTLSIALMSPLVEVRALELPSLREEELRSLVTRSAQRYFAGARGPQLVSIAAYRKRGATGPTVAAAVSTRLVAALNASARDAGWTIASILPAESAWAAAAASLWPALAKRSGHLIVLHSDRTDLIQLRDGHVGAVRRFRAGVGDAVRIADAINVGAERASASASPRVGAVGNAELRKELTRVMAAAGISVSGPSAHFVDVAEHPDRLAAAFATSATDLVLRTEDVRANQQERAKRLALYIGSAAAAFLILAGAIELWGVKRQLHAVQEQRAALKPQLATTLVGRTSIETAYRQLAVINASERTAPQWTSALVHVAEHLNEDSYLTAFRGRGDSVVVEGIADHAATVFTDLEKTPGLTRVAAAAPVRREAPNGSEATERFTIAAHLDDLAAKPVVTRSVK